MNAVMRPDDSPYAVIDGDLRRDRARVIALWRGNLGSEARLDAKYDWFYLECPWGEPLLQVVRHEATGEWVGVAAIGPRRMLWQGREIRAGVLVDMAVAAAHRSLGPALMLQRRVIERAAADFDLVYGFPNPKAVPVVKRVGYLKLADIVRCTRVLHHARYIGRLLPRLVARPLGSVLDFADRIRDGLRSWRVGRCFAEWSATADPRMQDLWAQSKPGDGLVSIRDPSALRWRFDKAAFHRTRYLLVSAEAGGPLEAWFACESEDTILHVRDFWSADAPRGVPRAAIDALVCAARAEGHAAISIQCTDAAGALSAWRSAGFIERDRRPVFGKWRPGFDGAVSAESILLTPADEDE